MNRLFSASASEREVSDRSRYGARLSQDNDKKEYREEIVKSNDGSARARYNLRARGE